MADSHHVGVIGLGLIGGSLAAAVKASGFASRVTAFDADPEVLRRGVDFGVVDGGENSLHDLVAAAEIIVVATPTLSAVRILEEVFAALESTGATPWITDVASVKAPLCRVADGANASLRGRYIPGHPIAGSEKSGVGAARADLFNQARVVLTPTTYGEAAGTQLVRGMWESAGAKVVELGIEEHDRVLAATSHLPHALAFALVHALASSDESSDIFRFAAGGFRDFTRIASSDPVMWRDISLSNADAVIASIDLFSEHLATLRDLIVSVDGAGLETMFADAKRARDDFAHDLAQRQRRRSTD